MKFIKLLQTSGLVRKKVLVRRKGGKPFWSTRWIQEGQDVKEVVQGLGFEVVEEEKVAEEKYKVPEIIEEKQPEIANYINIKTKEINDLNEKLSQLLKTIPLKNGKMSFKDEMKVDDIKRQITDGINNRKTMQEKILLFIEEKEKVVDESKKRESTGRVHLQGWMDSPSIVASEVRVGDVRLFNNGEDIIINIEQKTPKTLTFTYEEKDREGKNYTQNVRKTTKIVIKELYDDEIKKEREELKEIVETETKKFKEDLKQKVDTEKKKLAEEKKKVVIIKPESVVTIKRSLGTVQNEIIRLQNKIYYAKKRLDFDIIPGLNEQIEVLEKEVKEIENKTRELLDVKADFVPSKTMGEATERINKFITPVSEENKLSFGRYGFDLNGLKLDNVNSIIHGFEKSMGKYGITLTFIGWNERKQRSLAQHVKFTDAQVSIQFQKTATKGVKKAQKRNQNNFDSNKIDTINDLNRYLTYKEIQPGDHDRLHKKIAKMEVCKRWSVQDLTNDPLAVIACHEGQHAIYYKYKLESKWKDNLIYYIGDDMHTNIKCASVSEYGMSEPKELFAEVGAAVSMGIEIDPDVKKAYIKTMEGIR